MNAVEFVKNKGFKASKLIVDCWSCYPETDVYLAETMEYTCIAIPPTDTDPFVSLAELKRLIKSWELVEYEGGLIKAKNVLFLKRALGLTPHADRLEQAITDVENVGGGV
ncbi:hypothetical protein [Acinetobacter sp.]|uniref:hypothetical protein n=1 Tax=Acinetobacter sp. TaxID=472 RepID=UPI002591022E|nr:hypothetical protein [Acinetobacter sp.]